ncbi:MAG: TyrR/PhhR family helix-turn-helix DNA-binding protein [Clostridium sp.]|nr:TyrR/PhhR family helix-turn-helix DNA-binding protein [Clostridium sp.]
MINSSKITEKDIIINDEFDKDYIKQSTSLKETLGEVEKEIIVEALKNNKSIRKAAKQLGVTHTLLVNRIKKYNIEH